MRINIQHKTVYRYDAKPRRLVQLLRLTPSNFDGQTVANWTIDINSDGDLIENRDAYGNTTHLLTVENPSDTLEVVARGSVDTDNTTGVIAGAREPQHPLVFLRSTDLSKVNLAIADYAAELTAGETGLPAAHALLGGLYERIRFEPGATDVHTTAVQAFERGAGVCQDLAHLFCGAARAVGMPARYVSGHLFRRDGQNNQLAAHAWAEAYIDDLGWVAFDPAHGISADDHYVRIAVGADYRSAAPLVGTRLGGGGEELEVSAVTSGKRLKQSQSQKAGAMSQSQMQQSPSSS